MVVARLPEGLENRLKHLAESTKRSKSFYIKEALETYMDDYEDYMLALASLERQKKNGGKTISLEKLAKELGHEGYGE